MFETLREIDFDAERFKREGRRVQGAHYVIGYVPNGIRFLVRHTEMQQAACESTTRSTAKASTASASSLQRNDSHLSAVLYRALEYACPIPSADVARLVPTIATAS